MQQSCLILFSLKLLIALNGEGNIKRFISWQEEQVKALNPLLSGAGHRSAAALTELLAIYGKMWIIFVQLGLLYRKWLGWRAGPLLEASSEAERLALGEPARPWHVLPMEWGTTGGRGAPASLLCLLANEEAKLTQEECHDLRTAVFLQFLLTHFKFLLLYLLTGQRSNKVTLMSNHHAL